VFVSELEDNGETVGGGDRGIFEMDGEESWIVRKIKRVNDDGQIEIIEHIVSEESIRKMIRKGSEEIMENEETRIKMRDENTQ
jgi:hypothetical protein